MLWCLEELFLTRSLLESAAQIGIALPKIFKAHHGKDSLVESAMFDSSFVGSFETVCLKRFICLVCNICSLNFSCIQP